MLQYPNCPAALTLAIGLIVLAALSPFAFAAVAWGILDRRRTGIADSLS